MKARYVWIVDFKKPRCDYWDTVVFDSQKKANDFGMRFQMKYMSYKYTPPIKRKIK